MLSVIIIAKNEAENLERCLESVKWAEEIIVLDSGSTDESVNIAKQYTDKVYETDWLGYGIQKQRALSHATQSWVLNLDADETVSEKLKIEIQKAMLENKADAYQIPIWLNFYGRTLKHSMSPKNHIRLFKRKGSNYTQSIVHESILLQKKSRIGRLKEGILHHSYQDLSHAIHKMNQYSSLTAEIRKNHQTPSVLKTLISSFWMFFRCYFMQGGILEGKDGLVLAVYSAHNSFYRNIKLLYSDRGGKGCE